MMAKKQYNKGKKSTLWSQSGSVKVYNGLFGSIAEARDYIQPGQMIWVQEYDEIEQKYKRIYYTVGQKFERFFMAEKNKTGRMTSFLYQQVITGEVRLVH